MLMKGRDKQVKQVTAVVIGAGSRGTWAYVNKAVPGTLKVVGVAEPDDLRRENLRKTYNIDINNCFRSYEELFAKPRFADLAIICTNDRMHIQPCEMAMEKGYNIMLEKPISPVPEEVYKIGEAAKNYDKVFSICHVLRYTNFYTTLKQIIESKKIGRLISVIHTEGVGYWHQAHSFVRGNWRNSKETSPMILAKCCHDLDILVYLIGSKCKRLSSFGGLTHFKPENAPKGAARRCLDGCPHFDSCQYNAVKLYLTSQLREWCQIPFNIPDIDFATITEALKFNQYGRCVYYCDNDAVDHQVISIEFENGVTVAFTMCAFTNECKRTMRFFGTDGEIEGDMEAGTITVKDFKTGNTESISAAKSIGGHSGGDLGMINSVINSVLGNNRDKTSASESVESHMIAFAAEKSRLEGITVNMDEYIKSIADKVKFIK